MGDTTAGIRQAGEIGISGSQSPLDMVSKVVGIQAKQTENKLYQQHIENLQTDLLAKKQEMMKNNSHFMSGMLLSDLLSGASPAQLNQRFEFAKTLPNADIATITAAQNEFNKVPDADKNRWVFSLGASALSPDMQQQTYGKVVKATDANGYDTYHVIPQPGSPMQPYQVAGPIGGGMTPDAGNVMTTVNDQNGRPVPVRTRDAETVRQAIANGQPIPPQLIVQPAAQQPPAQPQQPPAQPQQPPAQPQQPPAQQAPGAPTGPPPPAQAGQPKIGSQGKPGQPPQQPQQQAQAATGPTGGAPKGYYVTPTPEERAAIQKDRDLANASLGDLSSDDMNQRNAALNNIVHASPEALALMGKGNELKLTLERMITAVRPSLAKSLGVDTGATGAEAVLKNMAQLASATGHTTDAEFFTKQAGLPNAELSAQTILHVAKFIQGLNLQHYVQTQVAGHTKQDYTRQDETFFGPSRTRMQQQFDPNAFIHYYYNYNDPKDAKEADDYYNHLTSAGKKKYNDTLKVIKANQQTPVSGP